MSEINPLYEDLFWKKVNKTEGGCWNWTASKRNKGYGAFCWVQDGKQIQGRAHRFSWQIHKGDIPAGLFVLHRCDNPACVNPDHLFLGTNYDNVQDMMRKGRHVSGGTHVDIYSAKYKRGKSHHACILNQEVVLSIRFDKETMSYSQLRNKYKLSIGHLFRIVNRKAWKHV